MLPINAPTALPRPTTHEGADLMKRAQALESAFLSEMLGFTGLADTPESFGGGIGETQFSSFLREEQSRAIVAKGGLGLAEVFFHALTKGARNAE
jgi:peptidoglycan hydrolase FlgJ